MQSNAVVKHAGRQKLDGAALAKQVIASLSLPDGIASFTVSGPGFINVNFSNSYLASLLDGITASPTLGVEIQAGPATVLDFGGPNVAKSLHVGHLRSFVIGESARRILIETGVPVTSDIHFGDWGLQMGKLLLGLELSKGAIGTSGSDLWTLATLEGFYLAGAEASKVGKEASDVDQDEALGHLNRARQLTTALQDGDPLLTEVWRVMRAISLAAVDEVIEEFDCHFDLKLGESDCHPTVCAMLDRLIDQGQASISDGAIIVPLGDNLPPLLLKSQDGSVLYGGTDLATLEERVARLGAEQVIYCVDTRQAGHLDGVFKASKLIGQDVSLRHVNFGTVKDKSGKPFKTRDGAPQKLGELLDRVFIAARGQMKPGSTDEDIQAVAIGALKFADLGNDRETGYIFDEEKMMAFEGRSGPYLQYACVRIKSMLEKAGAVDTKGVGALSHPYEVALMLEISKWPETVAKAAAELKPHLIAEFAFGLAQAFSRFYASQQVLSEGDADLRLARLALCKATLNVLTRALFLLGIKVPNHM